MLQDVSLSPNLSLRKLAEYSDGQSGSDLKELCRNAAMMPVREYVRNSGGDPEIMRKAQEEVRSLSRHFHPDLLRTAFFVCSDWFLAPLIGDSESWCTQGFELRPLTMDDFLHGQTEAGAGLSAGVLSVDQSTIDDDELEGANLD